MPAGVATWARSRIRSRPAGSAPVAVTRRRPGPREVEPALARDVERLLVAGVGVPHDARAGVGREDALELRRGRVGPVGDDDHAGVDRVADPDAAAVVDADPGRARGDVHEGVQDRPVGDRVGAVAHRLGLAVRRGDGARVEVVASDHDRRRDAARADELVDREPRAGAVAVAEPADPRRQALEGDPRGRELEPATEQHVVREEPRELAVDLRDVAGIAGEGGPPERPDAPAEERPDVGRDEARVCERIVYACFRASPRRLLP